MRNFKDGFVAKLYGLLKKYDAKTKANELKNIGFKSLGDNLHIGKDYRISGAKYIEIGKNFSAGSRLRMEAVDAWNQQNFHPEIKIGNNVQLNSDVQIQCIHSVEIGDNCLFAGHIFISDHQHGTTNLHDLQKPPSERDLVSKGGIIIEENVWVGQGAAILDGVRIGKNSIIATNAVVTKDVPQNSVVGGIPAKIIKTVTA